MGATPTHQTKTQEIDTAIWGPEEGRAEESALSIPLHTADRGAGKQKEGMLAVKGGTNCKGCHKAKHAVPSPGCTVPPSMPEMQGPWSCTTSMRGPLPS